MALFFESAMSVDPDETVSKVIPKMQRTKQQTVIITRKNHFYGLVSSLDMARRKINTPELMKIKRFVHKTTVFSPDEDIYTIVNHVVRNSDSVAVFKRGRKFFILTKVNMIKSLPHTDVFRSKKAQDIMNYPFCISTEDSITTAMSLFRDLKISILPVIDERGSVKGFLDSQSLLKAEKKRQRVCKGEKSGEQIQLRAVDATSLMERSYPATGPDSSVQSLISLMAKTKIPFTFVVTWGKIRGIVTATDILRLLTNEEKKPTMSLSAITVPLTISGLGDEDPYIQAVVKEQMSTEATKLAKLIPIQSIFVHVDRYHREGRKTKYALRARMLTEKGDFFTHAWSWDITKAMREILGKLEREIITKKEKRKAKRRR